VKEGIDIRDADGQTATIPLSQIALSLLDLPNLDDFLAFWESQTGHKVEDVINSGRDYVHTGTDLQCVPKTFFDGRQHPGPGIDRGNKSVKLGDFKELMPFQPGHMMYLLHQFLLACYPNGGEIDFAPADVKNYLPTVYHKIEV